MGASEQFMKNDYSDRITFGKGHIRLRVNDLAQPALLGAYLSYLLTRTIII